MANFPTHIVVGTIVAGSLATLDAGGRRDRAGEPRRRHHGRIARLGPPRHRPQGFAPQPGAVRRPCGVLLVRAAVPLRAAAVDRRDVGAVARNAVVRALWPAHDVPPLHLAPRHMALAHRRARLRIRDGAHVLLRVRPAGRRRMAGWRLPAHRLPDAPHPRRDVLRRRSRQSHQEVVRNRLQADRHAQSRQARWRWSSQPWRCCS